MNLQQLYYFKKIAETEQFTMAAAELHVTQAALSSAVTNLEKELGARLFERHGRYVALTNCGKVFYYGVRDAIAALERAEKVVREMANPTDNTVRFGYLESMNDTSINLVAGWTKTLETVPKFELTHGTAAILENAMINGDMDLAITTAPSIPGISSRLIGYQGSVLVLPRNHEWSGRESVALSELDDCKFIAYTKDCKIRDYYDNLLKNAGVVPNIAAESRVHGNILDMVGYGMGVALMPHMKNLSTRTDLISVEIENKIPPRAIYLAWPESEAFGENAAAFKTFVLNNAAMGHYL